MCACQSCTWVMVKVNRMSYSLSVFDGWAILDAKLTTYGDVPKVVVVTNNYPKLVGGNKHVTCKSQVYMLIVSI